MSSNTVHSRDIVAIDSGGTTYNGTITIEVPLTVGAGPQADLKLKGTGILPIHADLLMTDSNEVLIINLGDAAKLLLNGVAVAPFVPQQWNAGDTIKIGDYTLHFAEDVARTGKAPEIQQPRQPRRADLVDRSHSTTATFHAFDQGFDESTELNTLHLTPPPLVLPEDPVQAEGKNPSARQTGSLANSEMNTVRSVPFHDNDPFNTDAGSVSEGETLRKPLELSELTTWRPALPEMPAERTGKDILSDSDLDSTSHVEEVGGTQLYVGPAFETKLYTGVPLSTVDPVVANGHTLRKDWNAQGKLSALLTINPINLALGERIRVPLSVRNEYNHTVNLQLIVAGLPENWLILSTPTLTLESGEISAVDLILQTQPGFVGKSLDALIRLSDLLTPQIVITVPLRLIIKSAPDLVGWLDPIHSTDPGPSYLHLQNHAQETARVFIAGHHAADSGVRVVVAQPWIELPAGQTIRIPIQFDVTQRPFLKSRRYPFWVSATQGTRAPLDYVGTIRVRSHVPGLP